MAFYHKKIFLIAFIIFVGVFPQGVFAAKQDYLAVTTYYSYANSSFSNIDVTSEPIDSKLAPVYSKGTYEILLYDGGGTISKNFFEIPKEAGTTEVLGYDSQKGTPVTNEIPTTQNISVSVLPLTKSLKPETSGIRIMKGNVVMFDKKLSELSINFVGKTTNQVLVPPPVPAPVHITPSPVVSQNTQNLNTTQTPTQKPIAKNVPTDNTGIYMIMGLAIVGGILMLVMWKRQDN